MRLIATQQKKRRTGPIVQKKNIKLLPTAVAKRELTREVKRKRRTFMTEKQQPRKGDRSFQGGKRSHWKSVNVESGQGGLGRKRGRVKGFKG